MARYVYPQLQAAIFTTCTQKTRKDVLQRLKMNLMRNEALRDRVLKGSVSPMELVAMSPQELATEKLMQQRQQQQQQITHVDNSTADVKTLRDTLFQQNRFALHMGLRAWSTGAG